MAMAVSIHQHVLFLLETKNHGKRVTPVIRSLFEQLFYLDLEGYTDISTQKYTSQIHIWLGSSCTIHSFHSQLTRSAIGRTESRRQRRRRDGGPNIQQCDIIVCRGCD